MGKQHRTRHNDAMAFRGWPIEAVEFYEGLEADNSKVYWQDHRETYERHVRAPMEALLAELADEFGPATMFRPYRDVRFSADKSPYKTTCAARIGAGYVSFSAEGLSAGSGLYMPDPATLQRFRAANRERVYIFHGPRRGFTVALRTPRPAGADRTTRETAPGPASSPRW